MDLAYDRCKEYQYVIKNMTKYIKNKIIKKGKTNDITDLKEMGEVAWNFIASLYESDWDFLITDKDNHTLRQKVSAKFTPRIHKVKKKLTNKELVNKPASFVKISLPIPAKTPKEVNEISKYFKKNS